MQCSGLVGAQNKVARNPAATYAGKHKHSATSDISKDNTKICSNADLPEGASKCTGTACNYQNWPRNCCMFASLTGHMPGNGGKLTRLHAWYHIGYHYHQHKTELVRLFPEPFATDTTLTMF